MIFILFNSLVGCKREKQLPTIIDCISVHKLTSLLDLTGADLSTTAVLVY